MVKMFNSVIATYNILHFLLTAGCLILCIFIDALFITEIWSPIIIHIIDN